MALENEQEPQATSDDSATDGGGADDLSGVLGAQEGSFVSSEKKPLNTGTLIMGGFLLACGIGMYVMYTRSAPANAAPSAETAAAQSTITQFLSDDKENVSKMNDLLQNTEDVVELFRSSPGKAQVPVESLQTNPFRFASEDGEEKPAEDTDTLTSRKREDAARAATLKAAQGLTLQFVVSGSKKSCMINNARYTEGQTVGEFTVESIGTGSVVIAKGEQRFELRMKK